MQDVCVELTLNIILLVLFKLACLKATRLEPWLVQYPVQLYDAGKDVKTSHLNLIHVAARYGGVGGSVVMFTCRAAQLKIASDHWNRFCHNSNRHAHARLIYYVTVTQYWTDTGFSLK